MTVLQKLWRLMGFGGVSAFTWPADFDAARVSVPAVRLAPANQAALRLASLPRGFRQRSRCFLHDA